ncbi:dTDP-4-dehydrorhamnose 3,5-epimerase [Campylobacter sp. RM12327]|uniref:dTDP-4-dehydrorhamnose 3,5-epimerase n=1 Tax=Campylobacter sputorum TaxID=206 RepID=UPI000B791F05|nr:MULTISPECIES: dTDP-4-dehydrorhamnose 3,5-epimerase [Campylobacter]ASM40533.1 dTDP-4-dehydrorhamnose 3,5-epimerase [Campylobacter sputorum]MBE7357802.1 dTDP-4-dehydrorhamnose 3,5-epimerase [Campylobacter sp. RM11302]MBF6669080.1 dTDP-4-dehydrorhamnose 3,5-epimerase [Campylobacter sp. RM12327]MBF6673911.1 dTDP-4-dehydrorhamnose 3,5-epimerase [Campylobacter sp. RM13538]MBF6675820.1 dTDP-4-dehydrorhamnose 3,5-epimerase [Campylobacter sp. RM12321]
MKFIRTAIEDVVICEPTIHGDSRGYFCETFRLDLLENFLGKKINFVQDNESKSSKYVFRGFHFQIPPFAQTKLVRVIKGKVLDIAVDIRKNSPTYGKYVCVMLSEENKKQIFIPIGFAHGFIVLEDDTIFSYKVDNYYSKECDRGIYFADKALDIDFGVDLNKLILSDKDTKQPLLSDIEEYFTYGVNYYE